MATFRVGQRVRIRYSFSWPELAGQEGVVLGPTNNGGARGDSEWVVSPAAWGTEWSPNGMGRFGPNSDQLEPIIPEGAAPSEFTTLADLLSSLEVTA